MVDLSNVLLLVNRARGVAGQPPLDELPEGRRRDEHECVLARALQSTVYPGSARMPDRRAAAAVAAVWGTRRGIACRRFVHLPEALRLFVEEFDRGCHLTLVAGSRPALGPLAPFPLQAASDPIGGRSWRRSAADPAGPLIQLSR